MFWRRIPARAWLFGLFLMVGLSVAYYFILGLGTKSSVTEQFLNRKQTLARAEAGNIYYYFKSFGNAVATLSQLSSIKRRDSTTVQDMDTFVQERRESGLVRGVVLTDKFGVVEFNSNVLGTRDIGANLSDRDYFIWAKNRPEDKYFIGQPVVSRLGASKGQMIVPVAAPVYNQDTFMGVVVAAVKLEPLTERYLGLLKLSDTTDVFLIDKGGDLFYDSSVPDIVGSNIFELSQDKLFTKNKVLDNFIKNLLTKTEEGNLESEEYLIAYSPIVLGSQNWMLFMTSPQERISELTKPFYVRQTAILLLTFLIIVLFGIIVSKEIEAPRTKSPRNLGPRSSGAKIRRSEFASQHLRVDNPRDLRRWTKSNQSL